MGGVGVAESGIWDSQHGTQNPKLSGITINPLLSPPFSG